MAANPENLFHFMCCVSEAQNFRCSPVFPSGFVAQQHVSLTILPSMPNIFPRPSHGSRWNIVYMLPPPPSYRGLMHDPDPAGLNIHNDDPAVSSLRPPQHPAEIIISVIISWYSLVFIQCEGTPNNAADPATNSIWWHLKSYRT
ncbi:hypothetical protein ILYODFUR_029164 [Ilyodon furcidens]|uniref:Uncharacterized protein n=1 Tax=Ilyodon furcidens TaxID=33524 RepID=A0ABV0VIS9_9TELE